MQKFDIAVQGTFYKKWGSQSRESVEIVSVEDIGMHEVVRLGIDCKTYVAEGFVMHNSANPHLVLYDVPLDTAVLFGITNEGTIIDPEALDTRGVPMASFVQRIDSSYVETYLMQKRLMQEKLVVVEDGELYKGCEGQVWYLHMVNGSCIQMKCKPDEIESIHFAAGRRLSKVTVMATCQNAFENMDNPTYDFVAGLISEEYSWELIDLSKDLILRCIAQAKKVFAFKADVILKYQATGKNILIDKAEVMRAMSQLFSKKDMRRVFGTISSYEALK
jgi:hypothetical protein